MSRRTAWFISSKLYQFFVSDAPDEGAIQILAEEFQRTNGDIRAVMRRLFMADFFAANNVRLAKVKSPAELVGGTARLAGSHQFPEWSIVNLAMDVNFMGQEILNPPTVEGWHTGTEWIDTGSLVERINSAALEMDDVTQPGVQNIIGHLQELGAVLTPTEFVNGCLEATGQFEASSDTREQLIRYAARLGKLHFDRDDSLPCTERRVGDMLQMITATREYQLS
mgnify:CR=1 FL=1